MIPKSGASSKSDGAMNPGELKTFRGALKTISGALDTLGDLFGYKNEAVEEIRRGFFKLGDHLYEIDPEERKAQTWVLPTRKPASPTVIREIGDEVIE